MNLQKILYRIRRTLRMEELKLLIDVSSCNLKCVLCPRGGVVGAKNEAKGLMNFELFKSIIDKFKKENVRIKELEIGNWGEPLLNAEIPAMIRYVKDVWEPIFGGQKGPIGISTNLTNLNNPDALLASGVTRIRVSISGITQEVYSKNHVGGNIDRVLENILKLVDSKNKKNLKHVSLGIGFHDLRYNKKDAEIAKQFCDKHGLAFTLLPMYISSVEENVRFRADKVRLSKFYDSFFDIEKETAMMKTTKKIKKCQFRRSTITVNFDGRICRCCGVFDEKYLMGSILDYRIRDIPKIDSAICYKCAETPMSWR